LSQTQKVKRIGVLTGGGDCPGLNAVIRAVTKSAISQHRLEVFGVEDGFLGLIDNRIRLLTFDDVSNILDQGGTILGTSNKANPAHFHTGDDPAGRPVFEDVTDRALRHAKEHGLDALVAIGGDGTMSGAAHLIQRGLPIVGVPKTIDNDLMHTDVTFGFDTAVAIATDALDRIRTTASSHHRVMIVEMMGRNAGWITLHAGAASGADILLIPEIEYDLHKVCQRCVDRSRRGKAYTLVAVSEGAKPIGGEMVVDRVVQESPDPIRLGGVSEVLCEQIAKQTKLECRATILGHVQRGGKPTAHDRVLAAQFGHRAIELIMIGEFDHMVAVQDGRITSVPILDVADRQRLVPCEHPLVAACRATGATFGD
jgi:6-phosphofructokinase 1